ncbi:hypothetical protein LVD15_03970 [Fulvivirga maritima]|uniref:hypothetical protein n=1 Tax=Fulvivirga maritima TaxID=2904247 RepID=UPI001F162C92|nr:hypothetical protein [Fulvivirga maritima]UII27593.1 hypothetical protein LVD15_03970 [Fulvivirga maritima]
MRHLFLIDGAIDHLNFEDYKMGLMELTAIDRMEKDQFNKSPNAINSLNYANLYQQYSQENQVLAMFVEQLSTCEQTIITEEDANKFCGSNINGFLGIDFSETTFSEIKSVTNQLSYEQWSILHSTPLERLDEVIGENNKSGSFIKEFLELSDESQISIIELFERARGRNSQTPFYPDTKIIKDVTQENFKIHVRELRIYTPVALRVYFHEANDTVYLGGISFKSTKNQSQAIRSMYQRIITHI